MRVTRGVWLWVACAIAGTSAGGLGDSLWRPGGVSVISDRRASKPGDIVTILVAERSIASHQASHDTDKKFEAAGGPGGGLLTFFPELSVSTERGTSGKGSTTQATQMVDRISGVVTGVTPEGRLRVEAVREVKLNREELTLTVTGLVRPHDIGPDNTVLSTEIADCRIAWRGRGPIPDKQRPGLISALLSLLW